MYLPPDNRPTPFTPFDHALKAFLDDLFAAQPVFATHTGFHAHDDRWPDMTEAGRLARLAMLRDHAARLEALSDGDLSEDDQIDRGVVLDVIAAQIFHEDELREDAWDALGYVSQAGSGLFGLLAREFAPWAHRGGAFAGRLGGLPAFFEAGAAALVGLRGRPVSRLHVEIALAQLNGITELLNDGSAEADNRAAEEPDVAAAVKAAAGPARAAVDRFETTLRDEILPRSSGEGRLGEELFAAKLRHTTASDLGPHELGARAQSDYDLVRAEMLRLARLVWPQWLANEPMPDDQDETIRRALLAVAAEHRQPGELLDFSTAEVRRIEDFCRAHDVMGLPDEPMQVTWTPTFMRAFGRAFLQSPGPLDKGLSSYFWITPPDESLGTEATESYLREDNDRMLRLLAIHEGVPGHYLQGAYANRTATLARAVFGSGLFAEGWAVYVTQVMLDLGYGDHEPALLLNHWKFYLRAITNCMMDVAIHVDGMTEEQAMALMVDGGFQETDEARAKWLRARLTSTQLTTYYLGSIGMWEVEEEARRRAALAAGAALDAVPAQRIAGGIGSSPGFNYRAHLEAVVSHGQPPIKWLRRALFGPAQQA
ncbi:MAG TPA: DUF885 domain-containing protein [Candidatus Limnocylindria bacterium]|nr:DUF885 domain-containing protein [Candidatus Limnocylindria bacterium]